MERAPLLAGGSGCTRESAAIRHAATHTSHLKARFNYAFLKRFFRIMRIGFPNICSKTFLLLILLVFMRAAEEYNYYNSGLLPSMFYQSLTGKDLPTFKTDLWIAAVVVVSVCICKSCREMVSGLLYVGCRELITKTLQSGYFESLHYYTLNTAENGIDNPDQRITQDVDKLCYQLMVNVLPQIILQPFIIAYYTYKTYQSMGYIGPLSIYAFFVISTILNKFIMGPVVSRVFQQEQQEGDFRFKHVQVRTNVESIAFYQAATLEKKKMDRRLEDLVSAQLRVVHSQLPLNLSINSFDYISSVLSYALVGIPVFLGNYDQYSPATLSSIISENSFFSMYLLNNFSILVDSSAFFTDIAGCSHRVGELLEAMDKQHDTTTPGSSGSGSSRSSSDMTVNDDNTTLEPFDVTSKGQSQEGVTINSERVTLHPPRDVLVVIKHLSVSPPGIASHPDLVRDLNMRVFKGCNMLILGEPGCGKSSLLRVLRQLWTPTAGSAQLCVADSYRDVMFLPQKPYLTTGSLADQVVFPDPFNNAMGADGSVADESILEALQKVGMGHLRDRLGGLRQQLLSKSWYDIISPGEMQKISFARLFFHRPILTVLDEATSALSEDNEAEMYSIMREMGITAITVGHRSSLKKYHDHILMLKGKGEWQLSVVP